MKDAARLTETWQSRSPPRVTSRPICCWKPPPSLQAVRDDWNGKRERPRRGVAL